MRRFKFWSQRVGEYLTMVLEKAKRLLSVNHTPKPIHHYLSHHQVIFHNHTNRALAFTGTFCFFRSHTQDMRAFYKFLLSRQQNYDNRIDKLLSTVV